MDTPASFEQVTSDTLMVRNGAAFYRLTPVKGARVEGTVSVGVSSHEVNNKMGAAQWEPKQTVPAMWIDYTPLFADGSYSPAGGRTRETIKVNGREYGEGFAASVSGTVEFLPALAGNVHLAEYYPSATVDGVKYYLRATPNQSGQVTDKAREVLSATAAAIAAEFVTDERWHAYLVSQAQYRVKRATEERDKAQEKLDAALGELQALR